MTSLAQFSDDPVLHTMEYMVFTLAALFNTPRFRLPPLLPGPLYRQSSSFREEGWMATSIVQYTPGASVQLVHYAERPSDVLEWMNVPQGVPFCIQTNSQTRTLHFVLKLRDSTRIRMVLQGVPKEHSTVRRARIQAIGNDMTPENLF